MRDQVDLASSFLALSWWLPGPRGLLPLKAWFSSGVCWQLPCPFLAFHSQSLRPRCGQLLVEPAWHLRMPQTSQDRTQVLRNRLIWHPQKSSVTPALQGQFPSHAPAGQDPYMSSQGSGWLEDTCHLGVFGQCICRLMLPKSYWPQSPGNLTRGEGPRAVSVLSIFLLGWMLATWT